MSTMSVTAKLTVAHATSVGGGFEGATRRGHKHGTRRSLLLLYPLVVFNLTVSVATVIVT